MDKFQRKEHKFLIPDLESIRTSKSNPLYFSDIQSYFLKDTFNEKIELTATDIEYYFKHRESGIQKMSFTEKSGTLIGILGSSGTGKSTLLKLLNGSINPSFGNVEINGFDPHFNKKELEGIIGYISQDDVLIEELTVYENLFFNAQLCFNTLSKEAIHKKVIESLKSLGLYDIKHRKVGNHLEQSISGGQRKRLNIALELIREPAVLFVDEPTSGLSSSDSENITDILKELTLRGKLVFVVIHQPSSEIYKKFDKIYLLDKGGYLVYNGNPVDAVVYFKKCIESIDADDRECDVCGYVNPEQIFSIVEAKVVDEYGNITSERKVSPEQWAKLFQKHLSQNLTRERFRNVPSKVQKKNKLRQFRTFFNRDLLSKLANRQYLLVNFLEAPILAFILSFFVKYYEYDWSTGYIFSKNENIPQYLFIAIIVALFLGLTVSVEEIFKDRKILHREKFLNLSRRSYLLSKISLLFIISFIQTLLFVAIGNFILEIKGLWLEYTLILFSTSCLANIIGLNISSTFNSAKVIYIIVPLFIIPQLLFSGVIVKFNKSNPLFSTHNEVPWLGNCMAARWAYEALAVEQAVGNNFDRQFFATNQIIYNAGWKKDYWIPEMKNLLYEIQKKESTILEFNNAKSTLLNELEKEDSNWGNFDFINEINLLEKIQNQLDAQKLIQPIQNKLAILSEQYTIDRNRQLNKINQVQQKINSKELVRMEHEYQNEKLMEVVTNRRELNKIILADNSLIRMDAPIFEVPSYSTRFLNSPFYSAEKYFAGTKFRTFTSNIIVLWLMTIFFYLTLYFDVFKKLIRKFSR